MEARIVEDAPAVESEYGVADGLKVAAVAGDVVAHFGEVCVRAVELNEEAGIWSTPEYVRLNMN